MRLLFFIAKALLLLQLLFMNLHVLGGRQVFYELDKLPVVKLDYYPIPAHLKMELIESKVVKGGAIIAKYKFSLTDSYNNLLVSKLPIHTYIIGKQSKSITTNKTGANANVDEHLMLTFIGIDPVDTWTFNLTERFSSVGLHTILEKYYSQISEHAEFVLIGGYNRPMSPVVDEFFLNKLTLCKQASIYTLPDTYENSGTVVFPFKEGQLYEGCDLKQPNGKRLLNFIFYECDGKPEFTFSVYENESKFHYTVSLESFMGYLPVYAFRHIPEKVPPVLTVNIAAPLGYQLAPYNNNEYNDSNNSNLVMQIDNNSNATLKLLQKKEIILVYIDLSDDRSRTRLIGIADSVINAVKLGSESYLLFASNHLNPIILDAIGIPATTSALNQFRMRIRSLRPEPPVVFLETEQIINSIMKSDIVYTKVDVVMITAGLNDNHLLTMINAISKSMRSIEDLRFTVFLQTKQMSAFTGRQLMRFKALDRVGFDYVYY